MSDTHSKIIAAAAKEELASLGFRQKGRSRLWLADHGSWLNRPFTQCPLRLDMGDLIPFNRRHRGARRPFGRRRGGRSQGLAYPLFVAGCALLVVLAVLFPDKVPSPAQRLVTVSRELGRENAPPADAYYPNCDAARSAGVAPIYSGEPGYRPELDRDSDGVACEPYRGR